MKKYKLLGLLAAAMLAVTSWSCSDDDALTPLDKTGMTAGDITYNSLKFSWGKVKDARQYSYRLTGSDSDDILETGVTKETSVSFYGLKHDTDYTLTVLAYAAMGSANTTSEPIILTARTADLTTLATPRPSWTRELNTVIITWEAVDGARDYAYSLTDADGNTVASGSVYSTSTTFSAMKTGSYTFTLTAQTVTEGFRDSTPATMSFDFVREHEEIWRTSGTYASALLDTSWAAELIAYDDNSYRLLSWYGAEGYDFAFSLDESDASDMFRPDASYTHNASTGAYTVPTGLASPANVNVFASGNRCAFAGSAGSGSIILNVSDGSKTGNDKFTWGASIEDFVGTWTCDFAGYDYSGDPSYDSYYNAQVEITLGSQENTLIIPLPNYYGYLGGTGTIVVDLQTMTFTMQPTPVGNSGFIFAGAESQTTPLTGRISSTGITFDVIQTWYNYDGYFYSYLTDSSYLKYTR